METHCNLLYSEVNYFHLKNMLMLVYMYKVFLVPDYILLHRQAEIAEGNDDCTAAMREIIRIVSDLAIPVSCTIEVIVWCIAGCFPPLFPQPPTHTSRGTDRSGEGSVYFTTNYASLHNLNLSLVSFLHPSREVCTRWWDLAEPKLQARQLPHHWNDLLSFRWRTLLTLLALLKNLNSVHDAVRKFTCCLHNEKHF